MTKDEQNALLGYLEFNLTVMVEQNELKLKELYAFDQDTLDSIVGLMYDNAYEVLNEFERSYSELNDINSKTPITRTK